MSDLKKLALKLATDGPVRVLPTPRQISILFNGVYIVKTTKAVFVWEHPFYPQLYIPESEFTSKDLKITKTEEFKTEEGNIVATQWKLKVGEREADKIIAFASEIQGKGKEVAGLVKIDFESMDQWFEEATPIFVHPKDPFKRVDVISSTRPLSITVGKQKVAETTSSMHLYETGLPVRYYIPLTAIDPGVLRKSGTTTRCPYKGEAEYYDVVTGDGEVHKDVVWYYQTPLLESIKVEGLCCFYNEKVTIELDGEVLEKPVTHFGKGKPGDKPSVV